MGIKGRLDRIERKAGLDRGEIIIEISVFNDEAAGRLPGRETQIARQRAEGRRVIVVMVPYEGPPEGL
jgi:hypothetical protein